jgi:hypothetical protein
VRALALLLLAPLAAVLVGCGASLSAVAHAATKSTDQTSEHMTIDSKTTVGGKTVTVSGSGDFQNDPALGQMTMTIGGLSMHEVLSGTTIYMSSSVVQRVLPAGKTWYAIDYAKAAQKLGFDVSALTSQSPANTLAKLEQSGHAKKVGTATVDGVQTTHYTATLDAKQAQQLANVTEGKVAIQPVDVYVDGGGLVRRVHVAYSSAFGGAQLSSDTTVDLSNYGETLNVSVPSPADTYEPTGGTP